MKKVYDIVLNGHNRSPVHLTHRVGRTKERKVSNFKKENLCFKWTPCWAQLLVQVFLVLFFCTLLVPVNATMFCGEGVSAAVIFCVRSSCFPCEVGQSVTSPEQQRLLTSYRSFDFDFAVHWKVLRESYSVQNYCRYAWRIYTESYSCFWRILRDTVSVQITTGRSRCDDTKWRIYYIQLQG